MNQIATRTKDKTSTGLGIIPKDMEAEQSILGSILLNSKILDEVADLLKPDFFLEPDHCTLYKLFIEMWQNQRPLDVLFVLDSLKGKEVQIDKDYLLQLISKSSLSSNPMETAKILKEKFILRSIIQVADKLKMEAGNENDKPEEILDQAQRQLYEVSLANVDRNFVGINEVLVESFERISNLYNNKVDFRGIPTGFTDLDSTLGGLHSSDLIILAARPSMGKTSLSLEIVKRIALMQKIGVAFFSLEMSRDQLCDKFISSVSGINLNKIRTGHLSDDPADNEFTKLGAAIGQLDQAPIWIDDSGSLNILELRTKARRLKARHNVGLIIIDYLQLMSGKGDKFYNGNRVQEVSDISRGLKMLAKELQIPVIALSQLSRSVEGREDKRPMLSDLRESGSIEQDADVVMFIHRDEMYNKDSKKKGIADILIAKHRNGETGSVELAWVHKLATFDNLQGGHSSRRVNE